MAERSLERRLERVEHLLQLIFERLYVDETEIENLIEEIGPTFPQTVAIRVSTL